MAKSTAQPKRLARPAPADELLAKFMRGLGDPTRLRIMRYLLDGPRSVGEIVAHLGVPQSRVSNHLACLKWCGYVTSERQGRTIAYRVADNRVRTVLQLAWEIASDNAEHVASCMRIAP
jgi:ArsR family transcriptional regulator, cadmium/lead-responsive transcriptional repressor